MSFIEGLESTARLRHVCLESHGFVPASEVRQLKHLLPVTFVALVREANGI